MADENPQQPDPAQTPGTDEYNQAMAVRGRGEAADQSPDQPDQAPAPEVAAMPEGGADKFYNAETGEYNWQAHAREAEYRLNQNKEPVKESTKGDNPAESSADDNAEQTPWQQTGLDVETFSQELRDNGKLTDATRESLTKMGVPDDLVSQIEANANAAQSAEQKEALDEVGGQEKWDAMQNWAVNNMGPQEIIELNSRLDSPNWRNAVSDLKARYSAAEGTGPKNLVNGGNPSSPAGYTSTAQMKADMASPQYQTDPAFRQEVMRKRQHANFSQTG